MPDTLKVRMKSARVDNHNKLLRVGGAYDLPSAFAQKLLDVGEAVPFVEAEPDYIPPEGFENLAPAVVRTAPPIVAPNRTPAAPPASAQQQGRRPARQPA